MDSRQSCAARAKEVTMSAAAGTSMMTQHVLRLTNEAAVMKLL